MSLHCPATLVVMSEGDCRSPIDGLRGRRVVAVYTSRRPESVLTGRNLARELGAVHEVMDGLATDLIGSAESAEETVLRLEDGLRSLADLHRGETVIVLAPAQEGIVGAVVEVEIGDDGLRIVP